MPASLAVLSGNTGKARIQLQIMSLTRETRVLDVGAVGPTPLELWREIPIGKLPISVTAVDADNDAVVAAQRLGLEVELQCVNGYELSNHFAEGTFDLVICTQVLEHVAEPARFLSQIAHVLRENGRLWMTVDSAHFERGHHGDPLWKRVLRPLASRVAERYYDFGLRSSQLEQLLRDANLVLQELMFCNLGPLKPIATSLEESERSVFIPAWLEFEMALHRSGFLAPDLFRAIYVDASKKRSGSLGAATTRK